MSDRIRKLLSEGHTKIEKKQVKPSEKVVEEPIQKEKHKKDDFIAKDISPQMKEKLQMLLKSDISYEELKTIKEFSDERKDILSAIEKLSHEEIKTLCQMTNDENDYIIAGKLKAVSLINRFSKNDSVRKAFLTLDTIKHNIKKIKDILSDRLS